MKWLFPMFCALMVLSFPAISPAAGGKSVNRQILQLLKEKDLVTEQQFQEWNRQLTEEERRELPVKYDGGMVLEDAGKNFKLKIGGRAHIDAILFTHGDPVTDGKGTPANNEILVRRLWLTIKGTAYKYYSAVIQPDFTHPSHFQDATVDFEYSPQLHLRIGQFRPPFSLETSNSSNYRDGMFQPISHENMSPVRDRGIMLQGEVLQDRLFYGLAVTNGSRIGQSDADEHKDWFGRLFYQPFRESDAAALRGLYLGASVSYGRQNHTYTVVDNQPASNTTWWNQGIFRNPVGVNANVAGGTPFFQFKNGVNQNGVRSRSNLEAAWNRGPWSMKGEWQHMNLDNLSIGAQQGDFDIDGYYLSASYFVTGEEQPVKRGIYKPITPKENFDWDQGTWGAWQILIRYSDINLDKSLLDKGFADPARFTQGASEYTLGITWFLNEMLKIQCNYNHTRFDSAVRLNNKDLNYEDSFSTRLAFIF
ncbi:MAG: hypothetical protein HZA78_08240 [Candidatus Schekmanbacteria bacterium]|nr:hypothetical protein [Candidatus Schekmanbacteria bacterium]